MTLLKPGDRVELVYMPDDPSPIPAGSVGTVINTTDLNFIEKNQIQVHVRWDSGRTLSCVCPPDILILVD